MTTPQDHARLYLAELARRMEVDEFRARLAPKTEPPSAKLPRFPFISPKSLAARWDVLGGGSEARELLLDPHTEAQAERYQRNIENFVGTVKVPVGVAGPLRVNGIFAQGDYFVPLATTEAALVASYSRGAQLITAAGGCAAILLNEGVMRAPGFAFADLTQVGLFVQWAVDNTEAFRTVAESTTHHGKLTDTRITVEGNHVYLSFEFATGDASGQNMVTIATETICAYILENSPIAPRYYFVEANLSGDKKASAIAFETVRGKKVTAEVVVPAALVAESLHTKVGRMVEYTQMSAIGGVLAGTLGVQGHYANGLAALYIACGQDAACVAESAIGVTRLELTGTGDLYASVTLPSLMVGTVGGGTGLPSQHACLELLGLAGEGNARALAEVAAGLALAGELSIIGALSAGEFSRAHKTLARGGHAKETE